MGQCVPFTPRSLRDPPAETPAPRVAAPGPTGHRHKPLKRCDSRDLEPQSSGSEVPPAPGALGSRRPHSPGGRCGAGSPRAAGRLALPPPSPPQRFHHQLGRNPSGPHPLPPPPPSPDVATPRGGASWTPARQVARRPGSPGPRRRPAGGSAQAAAAAPPPPAPRRPAGPPCSCCPRPAPRPAGPLGAGEPWAARSAEAAAGGGLSSGSEVRAPGGCECSGERSASTTSPEAPPSRPRPLRSATPLCPATPRTRGLVGIVVPLGKGSRGRANLDLRLQRPLRPSSSGISMANEMGPRGPQNTRARAGLSRGAPPPAVVPETRPGLLCRGFLTPQRQAPQVRPAPTCVSIICDFESGVLALSRLPSWGLIHCGDFVASAPLSFL